MMDSWQTLDLYMENYFMNIPDSDTEAIKQQADFIMRSARDEFKHYVESRGI